MKKLEESPAGAGEVEVEEISASEKIRLYEEKMAIQAANKAKMRLEAQGFEASPNGFTFPGVVISEVDDKAAEAALVEEEPELLPEPALTVSQITSGGKLEFIFNQDMIAPNGIT